MMKLDEIQRKEELNVNGIMKGSVLTATVIEARNLISQRMTAGVSPYVSISIEGQRS